jgi:hypothetical protein
MGGAVVEQRDIEIFLTLAEELHFGRTAERLHVSTARVSQTIKKLERGIGTTLFERTSRHVALTPIGRRLDDDKRPDIGYIPIRDGLPRERRLTWRTHRGNQPDPGLQPNRPWLRRCARKPARRPRPSKWRH